ncbi:hypothetical protein MKX01_018078, partial [Papaver californicum]
VFLIILMTSNLRRHLTALVKLPTLELSWTETLGGQGALDLSATLLKKMLVKLYLQWTT